MIPRLNLQLKLTEKYATFLTELAKTPFTGEIRADFANRLILSTDNSIYQILPQGVVFPRTSDDLVHLFRLASQESYREITFSPRGGGTGTNGQSLAMGIVIDCSKYMKQILEMNLEEGWVRVQPGVILDQLNSYLQPYGVFFAPSVAPSSRATLGGMINTDACGKGSRIYGRTSDHILELNWILVDGTVAQSRPINSNTLWEFKQDSGSLGNIYRQVDQIVSSKQELIEQTFPKMPRFMTGYNLAKVYTVDRATFDLNRIIAGSEGTLAIITEAKLKLTKIPNYKKLVAIHYSCFDHALAAAENLLHFKPSAIETIDEKILALAKGDEIYYRVKDFIGDAKAINLVELAGDNLSQLETKVNNLISNLESQQAKGYYLAQNEQESLNIWQLRKKGAGLLGNRPGTRKPIAFIEDTAVPPSCLFSYIREFKALLDGYQLDYAMYGHVDVGCVHVRPALDLKLSEDETLIRQLSDQVVALVRKYGGVMWGEHGKGFRSEYTPVFFGEELYQDLRKIKAAFDPDNRLNPGKIVTPYDSKKEVVAIESPLRGHFDRQVNSAMQSEYELAFSCNGNGMCFNFEPDSVMCPSYKGMNNRIHSPKGRASLLREWLRQLSVVSEREILATPGKGEQQLPLTVKIWNTLGKFFGVYDYSHEVAQAMHGCLSCKACATQCPIHVDIPSLKAKFLNLYYTRYLRSPRDYLVGNSERLASWQSYIASINNITLQNQVIRWFIEQFFGLVDPPLVSTATVRQGLSNRNAPEFNLEALSSLREEEKANSVILLQDAFTSFYESSIVLDIYDFLTRLGYKVYVPPFFSSGKPLQVLGFCQEFNLLVQKNAEFLRHLGDLDIPILGIEPSITLTYRDEYLKTIKSSQSLPKVQLLQEFLVTQLQRLPSIDTNQTYYLLGHCSEQTLALASVQQWQQVFQAMGLSLKPISTGCCGMAGIYGHQVEHYQSSQDIYQLSWGQHLPLLSEQRQYYLATGYSCRSQVQRLEGWKPLHPIQVLG
ncbi:MAG: FAD-binding and (Fe-S)-binding domain-containing protein [Xenococcaceae cyanobacterium MO_167.B52]|nr:FAD-binding and (Fe-S)-binding domain-containing protein [Xenococcaceae cyanobacterium MO_167.B52]